MTIRDTYKKLRIPPHLQEHMMRVCGIVAFIEEHWKHENAVNFTIVKKAALLHDVGNIVKFDLDSYPEFLGSELPRVEYWKGVQKEVIEQYGSQDHAVTEKMLCEVGIDKTTLAVILGKSFSNSVAISLSNDWESKTLYYADFRTLPLRIGTLEERMEDVRKRMPWYSTRPDFENLVFACKEVELHIQKNIDVPVSSIDADTAPMYTDGLDLELNEQTL